MRRKKPFVESFGDDEWAVVLAVQEEANGLGFGSDRSDRARDVVGERVRKIPVHSSVTAHVVVNDDPAYRLGRRAEQNARRQLARPVFPTKIEAESGARRPDAAAPTMNADPDA